ncbi:hypothetical protein KZY98_09985 [Croceibacter atlanticus]|uniref:hypothetical protein n=1 Tax=Croceibacter atlanticus TaxID=313588 RepID=UPI001C603ADC|nr:hypothetical protein [Croceibacter atlanticus]MBW4970787.1 hypothetical protein [Croceibacter atlanticus]
MPEVNYIHHLNGVLKSFQEDSRLNPTHISLYMAFFQLWNHHRFCKKFHVNREDVMKLAKIGSKTTYHRCVRELNHYQYLIYVPSHNPFKGSIIKMLKFGTTSGQVVGQAVDLGVPNQGQAVVPYNKHNKQIENLDKLPKPKNVNEVLKFFKKEEWPVIEAKKFFNHYQSIGWKIGGKIKIENWKASAKNWMLKAEELKQDKLKSELSQNQDNLHTVRNKNYNKPL